MNVLLDTQAFLWLDNDPDKLSDSAKNVCLDQADSLWLSTASVWEMQIKIGLGKLRLQRTLILPVTLDHVLELENLPRHHKDPFDRLLIAQAKYEDWEIISRDSEFTAYRVRVLW